MPSRLLLFPSFVLALLGIRTIAADVGTSRQEEATFSTFVYTTNHGNLTFSLNAVNSTGDLYWHLSAPAAYQWVGIGTGSQMAGAVMWILYGSSEKNGLTLSPRLSNDEVEPSFANSINCELVEGNGYQNGVIVTSNTRYYSANVHCKNITALGKGEGKLDFTKSQQPFIYAWGPTGKSISTTNKAASIRRHDAYGNFWMDMTKATSTEAANDTVPSGIALSTMRNAGADGQQQSDGDNIGPVHAVFMCGAFVLVFPLGAVLLRLLENVKVHAIVQSLGMLAVLVGVGIGLYLSTLYNHSKAISSGHQVFGLILLITILLQWGIGLYHHLQYRKHKRPTIFGKVHLYLGPLAVLGGIINGFTGFNFSGDSNDNIIYGIVVAIIIVTVVLILTWKRWSKRRQNKSLGRTMMVDGDSSEQYGLDETPGSYNER